MILLDAVGTLQQFVSVFIGVYLIVLFVYLLSTWFRLPYSLRPAQRFLYDICEPYLRIWRRLLPFSAGPLDFSPIVAILALIVLRELLVALLGRLH
jgi:YggT family protein